MGNKSRYEKGDKFRVEMTLEVLDVDVDGSYEVSCDELETAMWMEQEQLDDLVNPVAKLLRLQKERKELDKRIAATETKVNEQSE